MEFNKLIIANSHGHYFLFGSGHICHRPAVVHSYYMFSSHLAYHVVKCLYTLFLTFWNLYLNRLEK